VGDGVSETGWGWLWHFLQNEIATPFTPIALRNVGRMTDMEQYNVLLLPDGSGSEMQRQLGEGGVRKLKDWVRSGGVVIAVGGAADLLADEDVGLSSVVAVGSDTSAKADTTVRAEFPPLASATAPAREEPEWIPGAIFRGTLDRTHWLTLGYEQAELPVFLEGSTFWTPSKAGANPVVFTADSLVLSGFVWPDNTVRLLKNTAWAVVENQGRGRVVLLLGDPLFRGFWRGTARLVTNAMLMGPTR
jgi:hypothetical protein